MAKSKINWLLILQGWAMLWVVIGHAPLGEPGSGHVWENDLYHFAYSFHMPLFMLVSGWLFYFTRLRISGLNSTWGGYKWPYNLIVKDKALRLLLPGLVFSLVALTLKMAFPVEMTRETRISLNSLAHSYLYPYDNAFRELWFIITLFWFFVLTPVWKIVLRKEWTMWAMLVLLVISHLWHPKTEFLCVGKVFNYAIWFYTGLIISKIDLVSKYFERYYWQTFLMGIIVYVTGRLTHPFVAIVGGITLSFGLSLIADKYLPKMFCGFRNYTYQIFLMGIFAQIFVKIIYNHLHTPYVLTFLLCIAVGLYVPVMVSKIIEYMNWSPLFLCMGLKKR